MDLGKKILELRKRDNLSQEQLAEKVNVTRQTISKWELGETSPDIKQAKELSTIFNVSLDELTDNNVKDILTQKVSNTEELAAIIIKILKISGILFIILILLTILLFVVFGYNQTVSTVEDWTNLCIQETIGDNEYHIDIGSDMTFNCEGCSEDMKKEIFNLINFENLEETRANIEKYFASKKTVD